MNVSNWLQRVLHAGFIGLLLLCPLPGKSAVIEIEDLVVFDAPVFSAGFVEVSLTLKEPIPGALGGFILLTPDSPLPTAVSVAPAYASVISLAQAGHPEKLSIDNSSGGTLAPGKLLTWRFAPVPQGATLTLLTSVLHPQLGEVFVSYVGTFNEDTFDEDTYPFRASTTIVVVPEPGSMLLLLAGLGLVSLVRLRRSAAGA